MLFVPFVREPHNRLLPRYTEMQQNKKPGYK